MAARQTATATTPAAQDDRVEEIHQSRDAKDDLKDLRAQIDTIRSDISALAELMGEVGQRRKDEAAQTVQEKLDELKLRAEYTGEQARDQFDAVSAKARETVRDQPGTVLAIATGIGFLAGLLVSRR